MPNLMQRAASFLGEKLKDAAGIAVTLVQGATELEITGTVTLNTYDVFDVAEGHPTTFLAHDWTFTAADLEGLTVRDGATITDADENVYEALPLDKRPCFERLDSSGLLVVVHTKLIGPDPDA
jgi:hypothetical protein